MKEKDIHDTPLYSYSNLFNVYSDSEGYNFFNLANNILFESDPNPDIYEDYRPNGGDEWATISYKFYGTVELWWLICRFNNITDACKKPIEYSPLKIPTKDFANIIANQIKYYN